MRPNRNQHMSQTAKPCLLLGSVVMIAGAIWLSVYHCSTWIDVVSVAGSAASLVGLGFVLLQVWETKTLMSATRIAVDEAITELRGNQYQYLLLHAGSLLSEIRTHVESRQWKVAALRLHDLGDQSSQLSYVRSCVDSEWQSFARAARWWGTQFSEGQTNRPLSYSIEAWSEFYERLKVKVDREFDPFSQSRSE